MKKNCSGFVIIVALLLIIVGCKRTTLAYTAPPLTGYYMPLQVGKYVTYRMDSLTFYYYGQNDTVTSYLAKDSVEGFSTDNLGHKEWRIVRYLNDTSGTGPWIPTETYGVTPTTTSVEVLENNLRFIKLVAPVNQGNNWNGNSYLPKDPYHALFTFSFTDNINPQTWSFTYQQTNKPYTVRNKSYDSTLTVLEVSDSSNVPIFDPSRVASKTYWTETYAKNIGLIYRRTQMWEYQPPSSDGLQSGYKIGFELTLSITDHN